MNHLIASQYTSAIAYSSSDEVAKVWFLFFVIIGNRKQIQAYRKQINCKSWLTPFTVSPNLLAITDDYDNYDYMRIRLYRNLKLLVSLLIYAFCFKEAEK